MLLALYKDDHVILSSIHHVRMLVMAFERFPS
jgi:hypothetical protein